MKNYIIETSETFNVHYNVLVEDDEGEAEVKQKFDRGEYDARRVMDGRIVEFLMIELGN